MAVEKGEKSLQASMLKCMVPGSDPARFTCMKCQQVLSRTDWMDHYKGTCRMRIRSTPKVLCPACEETFLIRDKMIAHYSRYHRNLNIRHIQLPDMESVMKLKDHLAKTSGYPLGNRGNTQNGKQFYYICRLENGLRNVPDPNNGNVRRTLMSCTVFMIASKTSQGTYDVRYCSQHSHSCRDEDIRKIKQAAKQMECGVTDARLLETVQRLLKPKEELTEPEEFLIDGIPVVVTQTSAHDQNGLQYDGQEFVADGTETSSSMDNWNDASATSFDVSTQSLATAEVHSTADTSTNSLLQADLEMFLMSNSSSSAPPAKKRALGLPMRLDEVMSLVKEEGLTLQPEATQLLSCEPVTNKESKGSPEESLQTLATVREDLRALEVVIKLCGNNSPLTEEAFRHLVAFHEVMKRI